MRLSEIIRLVWLNIVQNKTKVMLTSLGIIVGSATIVLVLAIGQGGQADVAEQFKNLNAGAIEIKASDVMPQMGMMGGMPPSGMGGMPSGGMGGMPSGGMGGFSGGSSRNRNSGGGAAMRSANRRSNRVRLSAEDVTDINELVPGIEEVTILMEGSTSVFGGELEQEENHTVVGVMDNYDKVSNLEMLYGDFITAEDNDNIAYTAVIGYSLAEEIFTYPVYAYGDYLTIDGKNYEIVGVLKEMGAVSSGINSDDAVFVPYSTASKYIFGTQTEPTITAVAADVSNVESAITNINTVLTENYPSGNFSITNAGSAVEAAQSSANTLTMLLLAVATIVFVVGGIGIMNVLFVSVQERTSEIGVLKAIGCPAGTILLEFLLEAVFMGLAGGILGVAVSFVILPLIEMFGMRLEMSVMGCLLAMAFAVFTGAVFGFYPAWKASKLTPIDALAQN
ncbi:MAG: ABC transporter permease [Oscillospiraceae bacterium]|nr:ABC transporter permease [Oscillospiraceae bacterium]